MNAHSSQLQAIPQAGVRVQLAQLPLRIGGRLQLGLYSKSLRYGLRRELGWPLDNPSAKIPIAVRPLADSDLPLLLSIGDETDPHDKLEIAWRRAFIDKGARGGFVAVDLRNDTPCYVQWLLGADDNGFIRRLGGFPSLDRREALLENAYTPAKYRGFGIMSAAMALIAERAADVGASDVLTFVDQHNIASLKGCQRAGFRPDMLHHRVQMSFGMIKRDEFEKLPETDPRRTARF